MAGLLAAAALPVAADDLTTAERYWRQGDLADAMLTLKSILQSTPDDGDARLLLAHAYLDLRQGAAAEQELNRASRAGAPAASVAPLLVRALLQQRDFARALDAASAEPPADPDAAGTWLALRAEAERGLARLEAAQVTIEAARKAAPHNPAVLIEYARQAVALNAPERARETLDAAVQAQPEVADLAMAAGELALTQGRFADADGLLTAALLGTRERWWAHYLRALARTRMGRLDIARLDIDAGRRLYPEFLGFTFAGAQWSLQQGDFAGALVQAETFLKANPRDPGANLLAATAALGAGQPERARAYVTTHLEVVPGSRPGSLLFARIAAAQGDFADAEETLAPLLAADNRAADALSALGSIKLAGGDVAGAVGALRSAAVAAPTDLDIRVRLAQALTRAGNLTAAARELDAVLAEQPMHVAALLERVRVAADGDDPTAAVQAADTFLARHPANPYALTAAAAAKARVGDVDGARAALEQALQADPAFVEAGLNLARLELASGNPDVARETYRRLAEMAPGDERVVVGQAQLDVASGDKEAAVRRLEAALAKAPGSLDLRRNLAGGYQSLGRMEEAAAVLQGLPRALAGDAELLQQRAVAELQAGNLAAAILSFESLVQQAPEQALPRYQLALLLAADGKAATAAESLLRGFELDPELPAATQAIAAVVDATHDTDARARLLDSLERARGERAVVRLFRARHLRETGDTAGAAELLGEIEAAGATDALFIDVLVREQVALGERRAATRTAKAWLAGHPDDVRMRRRLAQLHAEQGQGDAAVAEYKAVLERAPADAVALNNLASLLLTSAPQEALGYAERASLAAPSSPAIADTLGAAQLAAGQAEAAVITLRGAYEAMPNNADVTLNYARALAATGAREEARRLLLPIAEKSFAGAEEVQGLLESLR
jgi:cellulose synthase operon protein C